MLENLYLAFLLSYYCILLVFFCHRVACIHDRLPSSRTFLYFYLKDNLDVRRINLKVMKVLVEDLFVIIVSR